MKTYKKVVECPRLVIRYDDFADNPRRLSDSLGYFVTAESRYNSPDDDAELAAIIKETSNDAKSTDDHMELIKACFKREKVLAIYPVYRYEHSIVIYKRGTAQGFDYSNCGFYIVTDKTHANMPEDRKRWETIVDDELEEYTKYANGEVYTFELYDEDGELQDGYGNVYGLEHIESGLPPGFLDDGAKIEDYLQ